MHSQRPVPHLEILGGSLREQRGPDLTAWRLLGMYNNLSQSLLAAGAAVEQGTRVVLR